MQHNTKLQDMWICTPVHDNDDNDADDDATYADRCTNNDTNFPFAELEST